MLDWFKNYLEGRKQRVVLSGSFSGWLDITAGVPQGSILGPILFLVYINDIIKNIRSNIRLFADDTSLYMVVDQPDVAAILLNEDLSRIHHWAKKWLVSFNPSKTESLLISKRTNHTVHPPLYMDNVMISSVNEHKHLGVILSNDGSWNSHLNSILDKAWSRVNVIRKFKFILDRKSLEKLYFSFIRPIIEYSDIVWDNCTESLANELEKLQIEMARIVTGTTKLVSIDRLYRETGWERLSVRRYKHKLIKFFQMYHGLSPSYLQNIVPSRVSDSVNYNLRNADNVQYITCRTSLYANSFLPSVIQDWNSLPFHIRDNNSLPSFITYLNADKLKVPKYYYVGHRKAQILHTRIRTGCSSLGHDLYRRNLIDNPLCVCGLLEDASHYFLFCPRYFVSRNIMFQKLQHFDISLDILLYGSDELLYNENVHIFNVVHEYIISSKRFV